MIKVWKVSIVTRHMHIIDLHIDKIETEPVFEESEKFHTPGGAFDSVAFQLFRFEDEESVNRLVSNIYKNKFSFTPDSERVYKSRFYISRNQNPEFFI